jgi:hypothetical protein
LRLIVSACGMIKKVLLKVVLVTMKEKSSAVYSNNIKEKYSLT